MKTVSVVQVNMTVISEELLQSWANLYCQIWQEPPWNENFWQPEMVVEDFKKEMAYENALAFLAVEARAVVGFTQGYSVSRAQLREIAGSDLLDYIFIENEQIYYVDELGVKASHRGHKLSLRLSRALITQVCGRGIKRIVLRTDSLALAARHVYSELGFVELAVHDAKYPSRTYWSLTHDRFVL